MPTAVGGVIWLDVNASATPDSGEGVAGLEVTLTTPDGPTVSTTTDANGTYAFVGGVPDTFTLTVSTPVGDPLGSASYTGGTSGPPVATVVLTDALNLLTIRPRAEILADIELAKQALARADVAVEVAKAVHEALGVQVTKADERVVALTKEFGDNPTDAQKAQIAEAKATADRIYKDYEAKGAEVVRAIRNREGIVEMLKELERELNRKFD